ncbi:putative toxin-antitoxin system toxin component, PIN family [Candidatus Woesearchaeota archaeon]|nr:putative toxin-antitoxin system toxin component, PIN family [Candidatus Woesearchaeota archaeon]
MIRIVPDTNIIISSVFWQGKPHEVIRRGILGEYQLVLSAAILDEVVDKLKHKFQFPEDKLQELIDILLMYCEIIEPTSVFDVVRDKHDNKIISCAYDGNTTYIVTGDPDLLVLKTFKSITILTAAAFLDIIKK